MKRSSMKEYTETMNRRYLGASRAQEGQLLDEFVEVTGYHRKTAVRVLSGKRPCVKSASRARLVVYGAEFWEALRVIWEASECLCGKRLAPFVGELADRLVEHGELPVSADWCLLR